MGHHAVPVPYMYAVDNGFFLFKAYCCDSLSISQKPQGIALWVYRGALADGCGRQNIQKQLFEKLISVRRTLGCALLKRENTKKLCRRALKYHTIGKINTW